MYRTTSLWLIVGVFTWALTSCASDIAKKLDGMEKQAGADAAESETKISAPKINFEKAALLNVELGLGYLKQGQIERAKGKLVQAHKLAAKLPAVHSAMAHFYESTGQMKEAESEHKKAIRLTKKVNLGIVYHNYGAFLCRQDRLSEAEQAFMRALEDEEYIRTAEVYENAGLCALKAVDYAKAEMYLYTAIRRDMNRSNAVLELAHLNAVHGKPQEAKKLLAHYKSIAQPTARSIWVNLELARVLQDQNEIVHQAALLEQLFPESAEYKIYLEQKKNHNTEPSS